MKILFFCFILFSFLWITILPQNHKIRPVHENPQKALFTHSNDNNLSHFPKKSFYQSKDDWQYIIDTTWGPGLPLADKQDIFNSFTQKLDAEFDGFHSLGMTWASWDTIKNYYYSQIDSNTSRGAFCAIMQYLCLELRDFHTWCDDKVVYNSPLNPGVPYFFEGNVYDVSHFGAVTTVLPDSSVLVLRVAENHPLNIEPGDIILGYEGVPWKDLITELMDAKLPNSDWWGGSNSAITNNLFVLAGMNWHLFETMDVLKYSTGDTVHLSLAPMINTQFPPMFNNEQMEILNIPFPDYYNNDPISYGILDNTNIGYIYVFAEDPPPTAESEFLEAILALKETDALIIDMRLNFGGGAFWQTPLNILDILNNETIYPFDGALRCDPATFDLCPVHNEEGLKVSGSGPTKYDRPIAILLGPSCASSGEFNAYRLRYLYNVRSFGKPTCGSMGANKELAGIAGWTINYSIGDRFEINNLGDSLLNRREFPIDFPVWHNREDVAQGKDAVVEKALDWINNMVYPHNTKALYSFNGTVTLSTIVENPNSHQLSVRAYLKTINNALLDSVDLIQQTSNTGKEQWEAQLSFAPMEDLYKVTLTVFDETNSENFTDPYATRFSILGPVKLDSIETSYSVFKYYKVKPYIHNLSSTDTITNVSVRVVCNDPWVTSISSPVLNLPDIAPGNTIKSSTSTNVNVDSTFPDYFNFKVEIMSDNWIYWEDSIHVITVVERNDLQLLSYKLEQNFPNPFNPSTTIKYSIPNQSKVIIKVYDILGNDVETLVNKEKAAGSYKVNFEASNLSSGVYFYKIQAGDFVETKKMILIK